MSTRIIFCLMVSMLVKGADSLFAQQADSLALPGFEKITVFRLQDLQPTDNLLQAIPAKSTEKPHKAGDPLPPLTNKGKWILKFNPVLVIRGDVPLYLERRINHTVSLEVAAGITFQDYFKEAIINDQPLDKKDPGVANLSGLSGKFAVRFYPSHTAPNDFYISPEVDVKNYRKEVSGIYQNDAGTYQHGTLMDQQKYMDVLAICGTQNTPEFDESVYLDWFVGIGIRVGTEDNVVNSEGNAATIELKHVNVMNPVLTIGVKLGLGL
jgi:hypothetical protein